TDVEAEARSADAAPLVGVEAVELVEDPFLLADGEAEALVGDAEAEVVADGGQAHVDLASRGRVLDRVVDQVEQHLTRALAVAVHLRNNRRHRDLYVPLLCHPRMRDGDHAAHPLLGIERVGYDAEEPALELPPH